jgi:hypothetical protein
MCQFVTIVGSGTFFDLTNQLTKKNKKWQQVKSMFL